MSTMTAASNISAPTQFLQVKNHVYAYRRFGGGPGRPLLCCSFMGTLATGIRGDGSAGSGARSDSVQ